VGIHKRTDDFYNSRDRPIPENLLTPSTTTVSSDSSDDSSESDTPTPTDPQKMAHRGLLNLPIPSRSRSGTMSSINSPYLKKNSISIRSEESDNQGTPKSIINVKKSAFGRNSEVKVSAFSTSGFRGQRGTIAITNNTQTDIK